MIVAVVAMIVGLVCLGAGRLQELFELLVAALPVDLDAIILRGLGGRAVADGGWRRRRSWKGLS